MACTLATALGGCGVFTPEMGILSNNGVAPGGNPPQGEFEATVIRHVECEISNGIWRASYLPDAINTLDWLKHYGALVTLKLVAEDQSALAPNASFLTPLPMMQSFTLGIGGSGTANATRTETIQFTFSNGDLYEVAKENARAHHTDCQGFQHGVLIDSNLKIGQFIYEKAWVAGKFVDPTQKASTAPFSQLQFEDNFVATFGGNITPTWKFTRTNVNSSGALFSATRTTTDDVLITLGPLNSDTKALHNAALTGTATGLSIQSLAH